jgi:hypothetical protein
MKAIFSGFLTCRNLCRAVLHRWLHLFESLEMNEWGGWWRLPTAVGVVLFSRF